MVIGITGGIGSGKSTIGRALAEKGYAVYECDREAKRIIAEDKSVQRKIIALLGDPSFVEGKYNTPYVAQRVFADPTLLEALNAIIHPAVCKDIKHLENKYTYPVLFVESAILYEAGLDQICDKIIVVDAPEDVRIARTITRDYNGDASKANINSVRARINTQRRHSGDITIYNDGKTSIDALVAKITHWMEKN
jgi:dephospho-CoA kinase